MRKIRHNSGMWKYLDETGVLDNGTEEEIEKARKTYKKKYILEYKRKQRGEQKEFTVLLKKEEYRKVGSEAKDHRMTVARFLKTATLAYISKTYIVPDREQVARIEQTLLQILNEIQTLAKRNKILYTLNPAEIEKCIERMETAITETLRNPPTMEELLQNNPALQEKISHLINHDHQNKNPQNSKLQKTA